MAKLGLQYPVFAPLTETIGSGGAVAVNVGTGMVMGKLVDESTSLKLAESNFYADDGLDESIREFVSGTISLTINNLAASVEEAITGAAAKSGTGVDGFDATSDDSAPWGRVGLIEVHLVGGEKKYKAKVYHRVKFAPPDDANTTKGESSQLTGTALSGILSRDQSTKKWREVQWFTDLSSAKTFINTACGIS